jgi:hypothetical protein
MRLESSAGVDGVVSQVSQLKNDNDGRQKTNWGTSGPVQGSGLVAMVTRTWRSPRSTPPNNPEVTATSSSRSSHAGQHSVESQLFRPTAGMRAAYMRTRCACR